MHLSAHCCNCLAAFCFLVLTFNCFVVADDECVGEATPTGNGRALIQKKQPQVSDRSLLQEQLKETARTLDETAKEIGLHADVHEVSTVLDGAAMVEVEESSGRDSEPQVEHPQDRDGEDFETLLQDAGWVSQPEGKKPKKTFEGGLLVSRTYKLQKSSCDCKLRINGHTKEQHIVCSLDGINVPSCGGFEQGKPVDTVFIEHDGYDHGHCKCTFVHNSLTGKKRRTCKLNGEIVPSCKKYGIRDQVDVSAESKQKCTCVVRVNSVTGEKARTCKVDGKSVPNCDKFRKITHKGDQVNTEQCQCMMFLDGEGTQHQDCLEDGKKVKSCSQLITD